MIQIYYSNAIFYALYEIPLHPQLFKSLHNFYNAILFYRLLLEPYELAKLSLDCIIRALKQQSIDC
jgi:hypothetical protein